MDRKNYFSFSMLCLLLVSFNWLPEEPVEDFSVMSFNVLYKNFDLAATAEVVGAVNPDVIGLQEIQPFALSFLAEKLGYQWVHLPENPAALHAHDTGILTRFPVVEWLPSGVVLQLSRGRYLGVLNVHLPPYPYEPDGIRDGVFSSEEEVIASSCSHRLPVLEPIMAAIRTLRERDIPVCLLGDFNEPSHLDWTARAAAAGQHFGWAVGFPVSRELEKAGLVDTYRQQFPDEVSREGYTWGILPFQQDEVPARIDYIYAGGEHLLPVEAEVVRENRFPQLMETNRFPSDHFPVVTYFSWQE